MTTEVLRTSTIVKTYEGETPSTLVLAMTDTEQAQENCKRFREETGMSQEKVAVAIGVTVDAVRGWEQKKRGFRAGNIKALAELYGRSMEDFYSAAPPPAPGLSKRYVLVRLVEEVTPEIADPLDRAVLDANEKEIEKARRRPAKSQRDLNPVNETRLGLAERNVAAGQPAGKRARPSRPRQDSPAKKEPK
jgi:transcriptional regulator with XRE-family HTH domain